MLISKTGKAVLFSSGSTSPNPSVHIAGIIAAAAKRAAKSEVKSEGRATPKAAPVTVSPLQIRPESL
ncbi:hypothetical protein TYRP_003631 [Tyrophagus putrescentiae]|nr:hypothetical protein TYRP_003631 [Tyrophagus putrescentiae]